MGTQHSPQAEAYHLMRREAAEDERDPIWDMTKKMWETAEKEKKILKICWRGMMQDEKAERAMREG